MSPETATLVDQVGLVLDQMQAYLRTVDYSHSDPADLVSVWMGQVHQLERVLSAADLGTGADPVGHPKEGSAAHV